MITYGAVNSSSAARTGSIARNTMSTLPAFIASNALPAASNAVSETGTASRLPSSRASSGVTPVGLSGVPCASTMLPRLIDARSVPVGARSFRTSGETVLTVLPFWVWARAGWASAASASATQILIIWPSRREVRSLARSARPAQAPCRRAHDNASRHVGAGKRSIGQAVQLVGRDLAGHHHVGCAHQQDLVLGPNDAEDADNRNGGLHVVGQFRHLRGLRHPVGRLP